MSRSPAKSGNATVMKSLKEKWSSIVQLVREKGEKGIGGFSTVTMTLGSEIGWRTWNLMKRRVGSKTIWTCQLKQRKGVRMLNKNILTCVCQFQNLSTTVT